MKILAIETSTAQGSVSFLEDENLKFNAFSTESKKHSELVHSFIEAGLTQLNWKISDIDIFATTIGPGSFTGIRVSINSAKSFAYVFNKPVVGVDSLVALAHLNCAHLKSYGGVKLITCMINAYKNMVYFAQYKMEAEHLICETQPLVIRVQDLAALITESTIVTGDGFLVYEKYFSEPVKALCLRPVGLVDYPNSDITGRLALGLWNRRSTDSTYEWNLISPLYLRASEAEENKKGIKYEPL